MVAGGGYNNEEKLTSANPGIYVDNHTVHYTSDCLNVNVFENKANHKCNWLGKINFYMV